MTLIVSISNNTIDFTFFNMSRYETPTWSAKPLQQHTAAPPVRWSSQLRVHPFENIQVSLNLVPGRDFLMSVILLVVRRERVTYINKHGYVFGRINYKDGVDREKEEEVRMKKKVTCQHKKYKGKKHEKWIVVKVSRNEREGKKKGIVPGREEHESRP